MTHVHSDVGCRRPLEAKDDTAVESFFLVLLLFILKHQRRNGTLFFCKGGCSAFWTHSFCLTVTVSFILSFPRRMRSKKKKYIPSNSVLICIHSVSHSLAKVKTGVIWGGAGVPCSLYFSFLLNHLSGFYPPQLIGENMWGQQGGASEPFGHLTW